MAKLSCWFSRSADTNRCPKCRGTGEKDNAPRSGALDIKYACVICRGWGFVNKKTGYNTLVTVSPRMS